ncbi:phage tail tape measure protein [Viridibacillus arvi]|uniref:phage tail tape measure protein n=1 Tax=Viridibacillus arvi TaxID=263475 RepID=UPI0034CF1E96
MSRRAFEFSFAIGGRLASSFSRTFSGAQRSLGDLSQEARRTQRDIDRLGNEFRSGRIHQSQYEEQTRRLTRELRQLEATQRRISATKSMFGGIASTTKAVAGVAAVGAAAATTKVAFDSLDKAADFQSEITKAAVKVGASKEQYKMLSDEALKLGAATSLSSSEVAKAMDEMAAKGFNTNKIIASMSGVIAGAESSGEDLGLTADTVVSAINAFGLGANEASRVADIMAMSANMSAAGIADLGFAFKYAAPDAKVLGISIEELSAATGLLVDKGLAGEQAGTALRMAMKRLSSQPAATAKALNKLNITATDSKGKFKSLATIAGEWNKATKKLTGSQKVQYATMAFGAEASSAMLNLFESGPNKIRKTTKALEESEGAAAKAAAAMKDNYSGAKTQFFGALESAQIKFVTPVLPVLKNVFSGMTSQIESNLGSIENLGKKFAGGLNDILAPFGMKKPKITPEIKADPDAFAKYQDELAKYNQFKDMDFGEKFTYALDKGADKAEAWLSGGGGEAMTSIFTKLGELAAKAWFKSFSAIVKSSLSNLADGNIAGAAGMGAAAYLMGGGLIAKGAMTVGRMGYDQISGRRGGRANRQSDSGGMGGGVIDTGRRSRRNRGRSINTSVEPTTTNATSTGGRRSRSNVQRTPVTAVETGSRVARQNGRGASSLMQTLGKTGKLLGRVALPLAAVGEVVNIVNAKDKVKATSEAAGGLAGGLGGAKAGALIGSAIAPGIGTAIGGLLGGGIGYLGGKFFGGKAADAVRGNGGSSAVAQSESTPPATSPVAQSTVPAKTVDTTAVAQSMTQLQGTISAFNTNLQSNGTTMNSNMTILTSYVGQASGWVVGTFNGLQDSGALVKGNLDILASYVGEASGWVVSLMGIQTAAQNVISALQGLEARINAADVPTGGKGGRTAYQ